MTDLAKAIRRGSAALPLPVIAGLANAQGAASSSGIEEVFATARKRS